MSEKSKVGVTLDDIKLAVEKLDQAKIPDVVQVFDP